MKNRDHTFQTDLARGEKKEVTSVIYDILCDYFCTTSDNIQQIEYTKNTKHKSMQKKGIDFRVKDGVGFGWNIDVKYRDTFPEGYQFDDIGWETAHTLDEDGKVLYKNGWGVKEGYLANVIIWAYWPIRKFLLIDYAVARQYYMSLLHHGLLQEERFRRSYTKNHRGSILYYTWSYYMKNREIEDSIVGVFKIVNGKLHRVRKVVSAL